MALKEPEPFNAPRLQRLASNKGRGWKALSLQQSIKTKFSRNKHPSSWVIHSHLQWLEREHDQQYPGEVMPSLQGLDTEAAASNQEGAALLGHRLMGEREWMGSQNKGRVRWHSPRNKLYSPSPINLSIRLRGKQHSSDLTIWFSGNCQKISNPHGN